MKDENHDHPAIYGMLVTFFRCHPYWFIRMQYAQDSFNDDVSLSTELWEAICFHITGQVPVNQVKINDDLKEEIVFDPLWDEVQVRRQMLRNFAGLRKTGFFNQKAP